MPASFEPGFARGGFGVEGELEICLGRQAMCGLDKEACEHSGQDRLEHGGLGVGCRWHQALEIQQMRC